MERDHAVTTTIDRIMKLLARGENAAARTAKSSEIRIATSDTTEARKTQISSPLKRGHRVRGH